MDHILKDKHFMKNSTILEEFRICFTKEGEPMKAVIFGKIAIHTVSENWKDGTLNDVLFPHQDRT